ncbi:unnamed protein product [Clonostachys rosea]|uniref:Uncharacterized protein n=1 Tax=Bionectria ochroleuca TaxID=29856 RepID=A0ABY6V0R2_BIOOC|nr:unnamed protein product [Clonostachys rosea]
MLPESTPGQATVTVSAIVTGQITLPERFFVYPADKQASRTVPSLAFVITAESKTPGAAPRRMMFDLGLRSSIYDYTPAQQSHLANREPHEIGPGVSALLKQGGLNPRADIDKLGLARIIF